MAPTYRVDVTRDGKWWMIHVPDLDAVTQALSASEVPTQARDLIATVLDIEPADVSIDVHNLDD